MRTLHAYHSRSSKLQVISSVTIMFASLSMVAQHKGAVTSEVTSAWKDGTFHIDVPGIVGRSDIILQRANADRTEAMPLGNGRLGLGVWSQDGYTAQLNRGDTWPSRLSLGQVVIPGLAELARASDYSARLNLYDGEFVEQGAGLTATTYVDESVDAMVVEVRGAVPDAVQVVELRLWPGRTPQAMVENRVGVLFETWRDTNELGASGLTFGSLSAIRVDGRDSQVSCDSPLSIKVTFRPKVDGTFRILVAAPEWHGGDAVGTGSSILDKAMALTSDDHRKWWHSFWNSVAMLKLSSSDLSAEYFENLRAINLFTTAAESRDRFPGSQAGIGDLFSSFRDDHRWGPSAYWHWNLRMQVSANLGAGMARFNEPYFNLYNDNMDAIAQWTQNHMRGRRGICIPETMRFNGVGYENETWLKSPGINCTEDGRPYYNARTISTGAEVALWVWQQYLYTDDLGFLESHYPLMRNAAEFLLAYARKDSNGVLYTYPSNAHESNWDVRNPTTDVAAMRALFPALIIAAATLKVDDEVVQAAKAALPSLPALPLRTVDKAGLIPETELNNSRAIIASSYNPDAIVHNEENIGLEPVWPYSLIGDDGPLHELAVRTFMQRPNKASADWSADPVQAARLGLGEEMRSTLKTITERYQFYPSGMAQLTAFPEFYVEQIGVVSDALQSGLVQDYDGLVRVKPAWPDNWDADGTVEIQHNNRIHLQIRAGKIVTLGVEAETASEIKMRNPWPGETVDIVSRDGSRARLPMDSTGILSMELKAGGSYRISPSQERKELIGFSPVTGQPAVVPKKLGSRSIGLIR
ncbi:glycosyl hydrolase family 95 catalytic domain-containing protein [Edaphobacter albus]|uniref:glycosyl hydrolase family 95 catalytic domain-containing protein n=1 Tax=Edaphobacter sp. 4G125 TaxID=2763071 RepID=UPI001647AF73|nr:glycoside hydrolase [Edaphobacter sp. 4G125]QNI36046.1 glycoside hydrolase [Edaphobacter sp. 4G125]